MSDREQELRVRIAAALSRKFTSIQLCELITRFGALDAAIRHSDATSIKGVTAAKLKLLRETLASSQVDEELARCEQTSTSLLMLGDDDYPPLLKEISDPPVLLWVRGRITTDDHVAMAIVGSRNADFYGTQQAARFARDLGARRITVVSGLARGIDTAAHKGVLESGGRTIAVIGSGFNALYPPENARLAKEIEEQGALLSEFPLETPAHAKNFPQRNRIISGLSVGTIVAQATKRSGSLITARLANEQGREVFAIPGKVDGPEHEGCHALIRDGAKLVESVVDVLTDLYGLEHLANQSAPEKQAPAFKGTPVELALFNQLKPSDPTNIETLIATSRLSPAQVSATLMTLEMRGVVKQLPGKNYVKTLE